MKKIVYLLFLVTVAVYGQDNDLKKRSSSVLDAFKNRNFLSIYQQLDSSAKLRMDTTSLANIWDTTIRTSGEFGSVIKEDQGTIGPNKTSVQLCQFKKNKVNLRIVFDSSNKIRTIGFLPAFERPRFKPAEYANDAAINEKRIVINSDPYKLPGSISSPKTPGKKSLVIMVHGSGDNDRDETFGTMKPFRDIAAGMVLQDISVMRYEKRTRLFRNKLIKEVPNYTVKQEVIDDVLKAIEVAKQDSTIDTTRIFLCGHGFGAVLLPKIMQQTSSIKGLIFLTPTSVKLEDNFINQIEYVAREMNSPVERKHMVDSIQKEYEHIKALNEDSRQDPTMILGSPASYWYDLKNYDQMASAKTLSVPMLFIFGARDYQVTNTDMSAWQTSLKGNSNASFKVYPKLNHFFIAGEGKSSPSEYEKAGNVDLEMIKDIAKWMKAVK